LKAAIQQWIAAFFVANSLGILANPIPAVRSIFTPTFKNRLG